MAYPIFINRRVTPYFLAGWFFITIIHFVNVLILLDGDIWLAVADALIFNIVFLLLAIGIWYAIKYTNESTTNVFSRLLNHLGVLAVFLLLWISVSYFLMHRFGVATDRSLKYLTDSMTLRIVQGIFLYSLLVLGYYLYIYYSNFKEKLVYENELKSAIKEAELNILKFQIKPHFLFNSLNSISALTITDPGKAHEMIIKLSDFLRYSLGKGKEATTLLKNELEHVQLYLDIEKIRFGSMLEISMNIDPQTHHLLIPGMIIQPLCENAVKYGLYESLEPICICIESTVESGNLIVIVQNSYDPDSIPPSGTGIGLENIRNRLRLVYGSRNLLETKDENGKYTARLVLPQLSNL